MKSRFNIDVDCPECDADLLLHENVTSEDVSTFGYTEDFECIFCGHQFLDFNLKLLLRRIKIDKIKCQIAN